MNICYLQICYCYGRYVWIICHLILYLRYWFLKIFTAVSFVWYTIFLRKILSPFILLFFILFFNFFKKIYWLIYWLIAMLSLRFCARAFSSYGKRGPLFIAVHRPLTIVASLAAEHRLQTRRLSSCGSRAQLLYGMWDLPRPGLEPVSPALAGRFSTTAPPGMPWYTIFIYFNLFTLII